MSLLFGSNKNTYGGVEFWSEPERSGWLMKQGERPSGWSDTDQRVQRSVLIIGLAHASSTINIVDTSICVQLCRTRPVLGLNFGVTSCLRLAILDSGAGLRLVTF